MKENEVALVDENLPAITSNNELEEMISGLSAPTFTHDDAEELQGEGMFLPYLRMVQGNSKYKDPPFEFKDNDFTLHRSKNDVNNLGRELDAIFIAWRPLAMKFDGNMVYATDDHRSDDFKAWRTLAEDKNEEIRRGYQWGYEVLVWLGNEGEFVTFFLNNGSGRRFARYELIGTKTQAPLLGKTLTIWGEKIEDDQGAGKKYRYSVIKHRPCNDTFANLPTPQELKEVIERFKEGRNQQPQNDQATGDAPVTTATGEDNPNR